MNNALLTDQEVDVITAVPRNPKTGIEQTLRNRTRSYPWDTTNTHNNLFVYTLQLLSGGDLWKLCQVSKSMRRQVLLFMPRSRRLEFEIVRILHQGNPYSQHERYRLAMEKDYDEMYERHWRIYRTYVLGITEPATPGSPTSQVDEPDYQRSPLGLETPSTAPTEANFISRGERRDIYWALQAETLLQSIIKDTPYEIKLVDRETSEVTEDAGQSQTHIGPLGDIDATPSLGQEKERKLYEKLDQTTLPG
ncbi:hypothetical protein BGX31_003511 [Mortierella sp. GBA43]|nr:hypothetical protein BGX31_003511 [Mortierella sp. GBA43]